MLAAPNLICFVRGCLRPYPGRLPLKSGHAGLPLQNNVIDNHQPLSLRLYGIWTCGF